MNSYRYVIAKYKLQEDIVPVVNIGIIIQSDHEVVCKFSQNLNVIKKLNPRQGKIDNFLFNEMEKTLKERFSEHTLTITDHITREKKTIRYTDPEYLEYLNTNFLNTYIFGDRGVTQAETIEEGLNKLYKNFVDPSA